MKRAVDVSLALIALVLGAPMFLLVAILLRVGLGRPILVAARHIGFGGQVFTAYTFRTSPLPRTHKLASNPTVATCLSSLHDTRLDRLPQLFSILRGDMSFVGPRLVTLDEVGRRGHCAPDYFTARPGLVGLRPANRSGISGYGRRAAVDRYYARHWSIWLDLALLASAVASIRGLTDAN